MRLGPKKVLAFLLLTVASGAACTMESVSSVALPLEVEYEQVSAAFEYTTNGAGTKTGGKKTLTYEVDVCGDLSEIYKLVVEHSKAVEAGGFVPEAISTNDSYNSPTRSADDVQFPLDEEGEHTVKAGDLTVGWANQGAEMSGTMVGPSKTKLVNADPKKDEIPTIAAFFLDVEQKNPPTPFWTVTANASYSVACSETPDKLLVTFVEEFSVTAQSATARMAIIDRHKEKFNFAGVVENGLNNLPECDDPDPATTAASGTSSSGSSSSGTGGGGGTGGGAGACGA